MFGINRNARWVKIVIWVSAIVFVAIFVFGAQRAFQQKKMMTAIIVNGEHISRQEYENKVQEQMDSLRKKSDTDLDTDTINKIRADVLDNMIYKELLLQESKKEGIPVSEFEIYEGIKSYFFVNDKGQFDQEGFNYYKANAPADWWASRESYIGDLIRMSKLRKKVVSNIKVSEEEVKKFYESTYTKIKVSQILVTPLSFVTEEKAFDYYTKNKDKFIKPEKIKVRHLLITSSDVETDTPGSDANIKINNIKNMLTEGYDFGQLILKFSESPDAYKGGIIDYFTKDDVEEKFGNAAFVLQKFEISEIVKSTKGYHIIQLLDKGDTEYQSFSDVKNIIKKELVTDTEINLARNRANEAFNKLKSGADFVKIVKEYSTADSKDSEGYIGALPRSTIPFEYMLENVSIFSEIPAELSGHNEYIFVKDITDTIFNLAEGEISNIIHTKLGFHIIKCLKKIPADEFEYPTFREEVKKKLLTYKHNQVFKEWYEELRNSPKTKIEITLKELEKYKAYMTPPDVDF